MFRRIGRLPAPALLALLYAALMLIGSALLWLPLSSNIHVTYFDALFTSVSAVTVTGLSIVDVGSDFTPFGQGVIAILIEFGGLGLMTFATVVLLALGIRVGLPHRHMLREDLNQSSISSLYALVRTILIVTVSCQLIGAAALAIVFVPTFGWAEGLWTSVFHAVSAFNNAGFSLYPDSLSRWVGNPIVNIAITALILVGGIGFIVLDEIAEKRCWRLLSLHSKMTLAGSLILIVLPTVAFAALEWTNPGTLGALPDTATKLWASWFQAITPRTAGFNTIDTANMRDATTLMTMTLMLIGGGSTSTAGGIKVTTVFVLVVTTVAFFRRSTSPHLFSRSFGVNEILKVMALTTLSLITVLTAIFLISLSHNGEFMDLSFEVVSAFGTVGLSRGATADLDTFGRIVVMVVMFLGRVGPLTLGFFLATRTAPRVRYPGGRVYLG